MSNRYEKLLSYFEKIDFHPKFFLIFKYYKKQFLISDLIAGIIVGIVALPLSIAFAISSGVTPEQGIITAIIAGVIISIMGGSNVQIGGPTGAFIIIVYGIVSQYGMSGLIIATMMAGILLVLLGLFKLGTIIKYIPYPIIVGFTSGIALTIFSTQIGDIFGLDFGDEKVPAEFLDKWYFYFHHFSTINVLVFAVGIISILIIFFYPASAKKLSLLVEAKKEQTQKKRWKVLAVITHALKVFPGSLIAIILITILVIIFKNHGIEGFDTIGDRFSIKASIPTPSFPEFSWENIKDLFPVAITIAILGAIESLLSATVADGVTNDRHNSNTELIAEGAANIITPIFGGIPATGAIARTMTNINNGGKTPVAGIIHAGVLLLILLVFMPYAEYIPMVCLAAILIVVAYNMSEWRTFKIMMNNPPWDIAVLLITFFLTVILDLTIAIQVGIVLACLFFMKRVAETTNISQITEEDNEYLKHEGEVNLDIPKGVKVYEINGPYFFGIANKFEEQILRMGSMSKVIVIRMRKVPLIDSTGIQNLTNLSKRTMSRGVTIVLSGVVPDVRKALVKMKFNDIVGEQNICPHIDAALDRAREIINQEIDKNKEDLFSEEKEETNF